MPVVLANVCVLLGALLMATLLVLLVWKRMVKRWKHNNVRLGGLNEVIVVLLMAVKFGVPVCPHAGGVGLCEYAQHVSIFDYICVSASLENRVLEYVDHLHEHFFDPVVISNARYMPPQNAGYSVTMRPETLARFEFPTGPAWR